jgi:acetoin utilization deacetylase AcuC-like enzyme
MRTALVYDERCLAHDNGSMLLDERARDWLTVAHAEGPERLARARQVLERSGVAGRLHRLPARRAVVDELLLVHTAAHVKGLKVACARGEQLWVGPEARVGAESWDAALLSAGGALAAVDWVLAESTRTAYVLTRPPGHHASAERAMGFCLFNNVALAARHAQQHHGLDRVAIVDWDVHHGNGTQAIFYADPTVLFVSLHQDALYPVDSGRLDEAGAEQGRGTTVNVPLVPGSGDDVYVQAIETVVTPALRAFAPQLILVSAGQDAAASDPLGRMSLTTGGFRAMTQRVRACAEELCDGHVVAVQEGGYSIDHMPFCTLAIVEALAGLEPSFDTDPLELDVPRGLRGVDIDAIETVRRGCAS